MENITSTTKDPNLGPPSTLEIVLPPVFFILVILVCLLLLSITTQPSWWKPRCLTAVTSPKQQAPILQYNSPSTASRRQELINTHTSDRVHQKPKKEPDFLTPHDIKVLTRMAEFQNNLISLIALSLPALASSAMCPLAIWAYINWGGLFWPSVAGQRMPDINDAIANFMMPAGLVYAIAFGFAYQDVLSKNGETEKSLDEQTCLLWQTRQLIKSASDIPDTDKKLIRTSMKNAVINWMANLLSMKQNTFEGDLWDAVDTLSKLKPSTSGGHKVVKESIMRQIFNNLMQLEKSLQNHHQKGHRSINILHWLFLEMLGFISFFGILMVKTESYRLELTMCILTVFSITAFSYILSDLDSSYHGVFRISLQPNIEFIQVLQSDSALGRCNKTNTDSMEA